VKITQDIVDQFGRKHNYLRISLTERCNLRCTYCMPAEGIALRDKSHFMTREEIKAFAEIFVSLGVNKIRLTGGEPLVRKCAAEVITDLGELDTDLSITTNGILVDQYIETFKKAGLKAVNVSLDTLHPDKFAIISRRNYFDKVYENIQLLLAEGFKVKINVVLMKGFNESEIIDFIQLSEKQKLHIRFIEFMPFNGNQWDWSKGVGLAEVLALVKSYYGDEAMQTLPLRPNETAKVYQINDYQGTFGIISSVTNPFCSTCNRIRLTADGKLKNCLFSGDETDLLTAYRNGEDIVPLILESVLHKKAVRAGMETMEDLLNPEASERNRSMITIGG